MSPDHQTPAATAADAPLPGGGGAAPPDLHQANARLLEAQRLARLGDWRLEVGSGQLHWSPQVYAILGLDPTGAPPAPETDPDLIHPDDRPVYEADLARALADGTPYAHELRILRPDGTQCHLQALGHVECDPAGRPTALYGTVQDITDRKRAQQRLDFLAHHDALTGLPNRSLLEDRLAHAIRRTRRDGGHLALLLLDLDGFKTINDTLGHAVGDRVLAAVGTRLTERLRGTDTLARHGGDEFLVLLDGNIDASGAAAAAESCLQELTAPIAIEANNIHVSASIGIALYPTDGSDAETLLQSADLAMYRAKQRGRGRYQFHSPEMTAAIQGQHALEVALRGALARGELAVHYQPQIDLTSGALWGVEALLRWTHPELGAIPPARFIPVAERLGLISELGDWVLGMACRQLAAWRASGLHIPGMAINVAGQQLERATLLPTLRRVLEETGLAPGDLDLEVTESVIMGHNPRVITALSDLRALGVRLVVDDFGTGSSALGRLNRIPIDRLKIHGSFIRDIGRGPREEAIIRALIGLGRDLGLEVLAMGVEREIQSQVLEAVGCRFAQGYLLCPPMDAAALGVLLARWAGLEL
ncbi:bifunctional diguanylate cyclase/phosphodiesterase [uncultured Thiodictyon sp.]|uniref:putative bifunctional diguanylate cyclase/phosphodiesterase n=1 Tax=uncultured Thiodictyon sp. TaxID=1846217 RepID=UPI0025FFDC17|nr:GGDEF domain-containing phosphodiesterase [uncultured Thiodictyon sp.]